MSETTVPFAKIPLDVLSHPDLAPTDKLVFGCLMMHALSWGRCWPSQETIAQETALSVRSVGDCIRALNKVGLVKTIRRQRKVALYELTLGRTRIIPGTDVDDEVEVKSRLLDRQNQVNQEILDRQSDVSLIGNLASSTPEHCIEETRKEEEKGVPGIIGAAVEPRPEHCAPALLPLFPWLATRLRPQSLKTWFIPCHWSLENGRVEIYTPSPVITDWLQKNYLDLIRCGCLEVLGHSTIPQLHTLGMGKPPTTAPDLEGRLVNPHLISMQRH